MELLVLVQTKKYVSEPEMNHDRCGDCGGDGRCDSCGGKGKDCYKCKGTGRCPTCKGSGYIPFGE